MPCFLYKGFSCHYEEFGGGQPLLFLHGNTASSKMFSGLAEEFSGRYRVLMPDFLGHGKSQRLPALPVDLWYEEALQAAALLEHLGCGPAHLIGVSGGALAALNLGLERPDLTGKIVADSFEGECPLEIVVQNLRAEREASKKERKSINFYRAMHGEDWESVVDQDTKAVLEHARTLGKFFHRNLSSLKSDILLTGSKEDEYVRELSPDFYRQAYASIIAQIGHGALHLFERGAHPAALSNPKAFASLAEDFFIS